MDVTGKLILYEGIPTTVYSYHVQSHEKATMSKDEKNKEKGMLPRQVSFNLIYLS